jgi:hypothetical protein
MRFRILPLVLCGAVAIAAGRAQIENGTTTETAVAYTEEAKIRVKVEGGE